MDRFQENVKKWVSLDTQLKTLNEKVKEIRTERNELTDNIFEFVEENPWFSDSMLMI